MDVLEVYTKINIKDYLARPEEKFDKEYSKKVNLICEENDFKYLRMEDIKITNRIWRGILKY